MTERELRRFMVLVMATLMGVGCIAVFSSTAIMAHETYGRTSYFIVNHLVAILAGLGFGMGCLMIPVPALRRSAKWLILISLILLVVVFLFGIEVGGARRWFRLGRFSIQPSEFAKLALVIYLADFLSRKRAVITEFRAGFLPPMIVTGLMAGLVLIQPDLGSAVVMVAVAMLLLVVAKAPWRYVGGTLALGSIALAVLIGMEAYRMRRLLAFLDPWKDPQGAGFQILQSYVALAHGGVIGQGVGGSMQTLFFLPGAHTDFIFAVIGEELGLIGTTALLILFGLFVMCGVKMAMMAEELFRKYLICGFVGLMAFEAVVHVAVATGLMPTKGLPLPLVSYGGTAMVSNCLACAFIFLASRRAPSESYEPVS